MANFRYNVGDKVIDLSELSLWDNTMHFSKFEKSLIKVVTFASEEYFSVTSFDVTKPMNFEPRNNQYMFHQKDGKCREYTYSIDNSLYHFVHDHQRVVAFIKKKMADSFEKAATTDAKEIAALESEIRRLQAKIESIKAGNRPAVFGPVPQRQFLKDRETFILNSLGVGDVNV